MKADTIKEVFRSDAQEYLIGSGICVSEPIANNSYSRKNGKN